MILSPAKSLHGEITVPGDKSISHRAVMFGAISKGDTRIRGFLPGADCLSTIDCFRKLGIPIEQTETAVTVHGKGLHGLAAPDAPLFVGNSGTTMRLISGILAGQAFDTVLDGDASIRKRPMGRVITPLRLMGAEIFGNDGGNTAPLSIKGRRLKGIDYTSPVASAQVKSCLMLAGLYADSPTTVTEPAVSRDHTERMLASFGATITRQGTAVTIAPAPELLGCDLEVPGDISSAAYFLAAALLLPDAELLIKNVGINPTRDGILRVARAMGGNITVLNEREAAGEPVADLLVKSSALHGITIDGDLIPTLIDELPVIAVMAALAEGTTTIRDASELKVKESNRIDTVVAGLRALSVDAEPLEDGMIIHGGSLSGGKVNTCLDHRIAMSFAVASLAASGPVELVDADCVEISYPQFYRDLARLTGN